MEEVRVNTNYFFRDYHIYLKDLNIINNKYVSAKIIYKDDSLFDVLNLKRQYNKLVFENKEFDLLLIYDWLKDDFFVVLNPEGEHGFGYIYVKLIDSCCEFHSRLNKLVEKNTIYITAEEYLVASRSVEELNYDIIANGVNGINNSSVDGYNNGYIIKGTINCNPNFLIKLGLYADENEYLWDCNNCGTYYDENNREIESPATVKLWYNEASDFMRILYRRNSNNNEACFNIFDKKAKKYLIKFLSKDLLNKYDEEFVNKLFKIDDEKVLELREKIKQYENAIKLFKNELEELGDYDLDF